MIGLNYLGQLGQLGNQMFQYATLIGVADKIGTSFCVPNHNEVVTDILGNKLRIELFDVFDIKPDSLGFVPTDKNYQEKDFHYDESIFKIGKDYNLIGFFQTERYFLHIEDRIRKEFTFKKTIQDDCKEIVESVFDQGPIALHIRRGDYLINAENHHNLGLDYYEQALKQFDPDREVIIFSDDIFWASSQELFKPDRFIVSDSGPYHDLFLMTQCEDFIIANSTFSWWGAWLANKGKVVAPKTWFGPNNAHKSTKDLYPSNWTILDF